MTSSNPSSFLNQVFKRLSIFKRPSSKIPSPSSIYNSLTSCSNPKRSIPSFVPSDKTLELRITTKLNSNNSNRFRQINHHLKEIPQSSISSDHQSALKSQISHLSNREKIEKSLIRHSSWREDNWTIRCTLINKNGQIVHSRPMSKSEICAQNRLQPRDLRKIDSRISNLVPSILVRDEAIIFNVLNIRALIRADSIIIFEDSGCPSVSISHHRSENSDQLSGNCSSHFSVRSAFLHQLLNNLRDHPEQSSEKAIELPYEFRALETMLGSVATTLESELGVLKTLVSSLLDGLEENIEREKLKQLLLYSRRLSAFNGRALLVQRCLDEILENEQDMANSYLTDKILKKMPREPDDHEEFEQLLESFSKYVEEIVHEGASTLTNIKSTEEIIDLILDSNRNTLLALDLKVSIGTMGLGIGAFTAGLFGMNLRTHLEQDPYAFFIVTGCSMVAVGATIAYGCRRLYRLRRVGLSSLSSTYHDHQVSHPLSSRRLAPGPSPAHHHHADGILDWDAPLRPSAHKL